MFESGYRGPDIVQGSQASFWSASPSYSPDSGYFPAFEPFSDASVHTISRGQPLPSSQPSADRRRVETNILPPTLPPLSWSGQRCRTSSDWLKAEDIGDRGLQLGANEAIFRSTQTQSVPPQRQSSGQVHEVGSPRDYYILG